MGSRTKIEDALSNPNFLASSVDTSAMTISFVEAEAGELAGDVGHGFERSIPSATYSVDQILEAAVHRINTGEPPRFVFMTDFCGSTLLLNTLRCLSDVVGLNQIDLFSELSIAKRRIDRIVDDGERARRLRIWKRMLRVVVYLAGSRGSSRVVVIKEWPLSNYIMSDILASDERVRAIFLYGSRYDYLNAVFRRPWRRGAVRQRVLFLSETDRWPLIHLAKRSFTDAQLAALHWFVQQHLFLQTEPRLFGQLGSVFAGDLFSRGAETVRRVARHFGLSVSTADSESLYTMVSQRHSKSGALYSAAARDREVFETEMVYGPHIEEALEQLAEWERGNGIPDRLPGQLPEC